MRKNTVAAHLIAKKKKVHKEFNVYNYLELICLDAFNSFFKKLTGHTPFLEKRQKLDNLNDFQICNNSQVRLGEKESPMEIKRHN